MRVALVTGASRGIGLAVAERLRDDGWRVETAERSSGVDLADAAAAREVVERLDRIDALVANAGTIVRKSVLEHTLEDWQRVLDVNLTAAFVTAQAAARRMVESGGGAIVLVSSALAVVGGVNVASYAASKGGVAQLAKALSNELAGRGVRVNAIGPGATVTPINRAWIDDPVKREMVTAHIPMGRAGDAEEMAAVTAFLCSDEAAYITGQTVFVDGGLTLYPDFRTAWSSE
jgi:glucose 1-dehydrogenase